MVKLSVEEKKSLQNKDQSADVSESNSTVLISAVRPDYKMVKELRQFCPFCKERLSGNNSIVLPYKCSCGTWKQNVRDLTFSIKSR